MFQESFNSECKEGAEIKAKLGSDFFSIKLGNNTIVLLKAPDGTTATIMPLTT